MTIQKIIPPGKNVKSLYYKELDNLKRDKEIDTSLDIDVSFPLRIRKGDIISFETYYNAFLVEKWQRYTKVNSIKIVIRTTKEVHIQIYNSTGVYKWDTQRRFSGKKEIDTDIICSDKDGYKEYSISVKDNNLSGVIFPIIEATKDCDFISGEYSSDITVEKNEIKPCYIINYNKDADCTRKSINTIIKSPLYNMEHIIVCDMTGELSDDVFIDNSHVCSRIIQIPTSSNIGESYNKAILHLNCEISENYTHAVLIDYKVALMDVDFERVISFLSLLDDVRQDMIIQGDILSDKYLIDSSGYVIRDDKPDLRFYGFDIRKPSDFVVSSTFENLDFFSFGLLFMPLGQTEIFDSKLRTNVEFDYYLRHKRLEITNLNGFCATHNKKESNGLVWNYYYNYRDYSIAIIDSDYELDKTEYRFFIEKEINRLRREDNFELAFAIIEAANDFLNGPDGLYDNDCLEEIEERLIYLSDRFNDSIIKRKNIIRDRLELSKSYNKLCLKIDHNYDMIIDKWTKNKRKVENERE